MTSDERSALNDPTLLEDTHFVDVRQYLELLVSRRKLDVVSNRREWLRDRDSAEIFVLQGSSDASVEQPA
jgi:hypothetical protein